LELAVDFEVFTGEQLPPPTSKKADNPDEQFDYLVKAKVLATLIRNLEKLVKQTLVPDGRCHHTPTLGRLGLPPCAGLMMRPKFVAGSRTELRIQQIIAYAKQLYIGKHGPTDLRKARWTGFLLDPTRNLDSALIAGLVDNPSASAGSASSSAPSAEPTAALAEGTEAQCTLPRQSNVGTEPEPPLEWEPDDYFENVISEQVDLATSVRSSAVVRAPSAARFEMNPIDDPEGYDDPGEWEDWEPPPPPLQHLPTQGTSRFPFGIGPGIGESSSSTAAAPRSGGEFTDLPRNEDRRYKRRRREPGELATETNPVHARIIDLEVLTRLPQNHVNHPWCCRPAMLSLATKKRARHRRAAVMAARNADQQREFAGFAWRTAHGHQPFDEA